ncbi:hypothetical protein ONS96_004592 [Cadophora gregata f. sp. sojae]|nr:hypothetical protein ONS96_004592 [Cadophora gregata f. sp. sojae]
MASSGTRNRKAATSLNQHTTKKIQQDQRMQLKRWEELPLWQQEGSHFIETGYRPPSGSMLNSFKSWGYLHNESVNIYSHLIGSLLFFAAPIYIFKTEIPPRYKVATSADIGVCTIYFIGVAICFLLSAT